MHFIQPLLRGNCFTTWSFTFAWESKKVAIFPALRGNAIGIVFPYVLILTTSIIEAVRDMQSVAGDGQLIINQCTFTGYCVVTILLLVSLPFHGSPRKRRSCLHCHSVFPSEDARSLYLDWATLRQTETKQENNIRYKRNYMTFTWQCQNHNAIWCDIQNYPTTTYHIRNHDTKWTLLRCQFLKFSGRQFKLPISQLRDFTGSYDRKCQEYVYIKWEYWSTM